MMNRSRRLLLGGVAALAMAAAIAVFAQGPAGPGPGARGHHGPWGADQNPADMLAKRLGLTEAQKAQIQPILDAAKPQLKAIHDEARTKTKAVMDDVNIKIAPFLTPEQQEDLRSMQRQMKRMHNLGASTRSGSEIFERDGGSS
jgi:Spy/CpxP family protein refolding chaperone